MKHPKKQISRSTKHLYSIVVLLYLTNFYVFLSAWLGIEYRLTGAVMIGMGGLVLIRQYNAGWLQALPRVVIVSMVILFVLPVLTSLYAPIFSIRNIAVVFLAAVISVTTIAQIKTQGPRILRRLVAIAMWISVIGVWWSAVNPAFFRIIALHNLGLSEGLAGIEGVRVSTESMGRAFGFFFQPNKAGITLVLMFAVYNSTFVGRIRWTNVLSFLAIGFTIYLTGSRLAALLFALVIASIAFTEVRPRFSKDLRNRPGRANFAFISVSFLIFTIVVLAALGPETNERGFGGEPNLANRFSSLLDPDTYKGEDTSVYGRYSAQKVFFEESIRSPLFGYGLGAAMYDVKITRSLPRSAHSTFFTNLYDYGWVLAFAIQALLFWLCWRTFQSRNAFLGRLLPLALALAIGGVISGGVIEFRTFPFFLGFLLGGLVFAGSSESKLARPIVRHLQYRRSKNYI